MSELDFAKLKEFDNHKLVLKIEDKKAGLNGFIVIHNNNLGTPAVGGTRMLPYKTEEDALIDALRLSRAMTYKCAMAQVAHGGGKAVIIGDPKKDKTDALLKAYAGKINFLNGQFCTGEDVGISQDDVNLMLKYSNYFIGKPNCAEDPSPFAALSVFYSMKSAVEYIFKKDYLQGMKIGVKGAGKVGSALIKLLSKENAEIFVSDIDKNAIDRVKKDFPNIKIADNSTIQTLPLDIYSPCALGNEFSIQNAGQIKAKIICGAANNQLADEEVGGRLFKNNIIYIPDYVANGGGLIDVVDELERGGFCKPRVLERIENIKNVVKKILDRAFEENKSPHRISEETAEKYFGAVK